jgi:hypothetical protein
MGISISREESDGRAMNKAILNKNATRVSALVVCLVDVPDIIF